MIRQQPLQCPDLIQQVELGRGVVAVIADGLAHDVPVLLLHVSAIVLVARPGPGEHQILGFTPAEQLPVDELAAVIRIDSQDRAWEARSGVLDS